MSASPSEEARWLRRYQPTENPVGTLLCLPHAGGSASFYLPVSRALAPDVDVVAVQYPGRQDRRTEPLIDDLATLADRIHALLALAPQRPLALFGHSMGALLAFEIARRLEADGHRPAHLFVSGRRGPATYRDERAHRSDEEIMAEVRALSGTASALLGDEEMMRAALPSLRADYKAVETYRCEPDASVACPVTVLTGDDDPKTTVDEAKAWDGHTTGAFDLRVFSGGHFFLGSHALEINQLLKRSF
ncbi:thioesterase II family protein [Streptomyces canus]|uniref:thioesterase II family protein n=1 Tax=Streptomyces canus TaxID=58343 RepID=UPI002250F3B8|nr:alpha/beta fold hydrolase [Streptomyces canus]MCX4862351.1 alpha/beta fold hydrolase [Streptomyces canus]